ncbi:MAG: hypothetical protein HY360_00910 [Verrucomicrobia bacterium]|nr:hypothetical protein [Verrucomicrobiota bacterium]
MTSSAIITALMRGRCRIPLGEPDETGANWNDIPPIIIPSSSSLIEYSLAPWKPPKTEVRAMAGNDALFLRFDCALDDPARLTPNSPSQPLSELERARVHLYPGNDPVEWYRFEADFKGVTAITRHQRINGERSLGAVPDLWQASVPVAVDWTIYHGFNRHAWWVEMVIPWEAVGLRARPAVIGLECGRVYHTGQKGIPMDDLTWPDPRRDSTCEATLGEALIGPDAVAPQQLALDAPGFGKNRGRLILGNLWTEKAGILRARTESADGKLVAEKDFPIAPGVRDVSFEYWLDRSLCSHLDVFAPQRLVIQAKNAASDAVLYEARLPMDRHLGICVDEPYGEPESAELAPGRAPTLREKMLDRATRALPRLERRTTAQGAPSDFCLTGPDGRVVVNLMADGAWDRFAGIVEERFQTTEERLVAALALVGQKSVTNLLLSSKFFDATMAPTYAHGNFHDKMGPLSILRYGGGPAVARAVVLARLLQQVRDPRNDRPFVTRVLSLFQDGGPKPAERHNPFWQKAGPVGVVAVEYGRGQTLLDPTTLAFFVKSDGWLATMSEMIADENILAEGAGRMAPVFAKIDPDEVDHEQPDRRLSKGVFPELCPDEDRPDRPFDPRERQTPRAIIAPEGRESKPLEGFVDVFEKRGRRDGAVRVCWDQQGLYVRVNVRNAAVQWREAIDRDCEQVHLALDTEHGHFRFHHFMINAAGERKLWRDHVTNIQTLFKHLSTEQSHGSPDITDAAWNGEMTPTSDGYLATFELPWKSLGLARLVHPSNTGAACRCDSTGNPEISGSRKLPPVIGLNVWIQGRVPFYEQLFLCPPRWHIAADPFHFADLYLNDTPLILTEIDLGIPTWGDNLGEVAVFNSSDREITVVLAAENHLGKRRWVHRCPAATAAVPAGAVKRVPFAFYVNPEEKMGAPQKIILRAQRDGSEWFHARWAVEYAGPVSVYYRYGSAIVKTPNPQRGDADFLNRKIRYICSHLPQFRRLTTRDGAASDFVLRAEDGSVEFNLMQTGVLDRMGESIAGLFENDLDRILGMYFLSHAPPVARHISWGHRILEGADPLSVIRGNFAGGGGNCGYHSRVFGGMAAHLKLNGKNLIAHGSVSVFGHVISAVERRGSKAIMDADVGHFMLTSDGGDLATLEEFRANPDILATAGPGDLARYYTVNDEAVRIRSGMFGQSVKGMFPPGAPQE